MKKTNRALSLLTAALLMASLMTACGGGGSDSSDIPPESGGTESPTTEQGDAESGKTDESEASQAGAPQENQYPLETDGDVTLTVYCRNNNSSNIDNFGDIAGMKQAAENIGVNLEFQHPTTGSELEQFNIMIASGEYPDIVMWDFTQTPMSLASYVEDGVFVDLDPYIRQYAPNYLALLESKDEYRREATSDNGHYQALYSFNSDLPISGGPTLRADLLEKYNLEVPTTVDEWTQTLTALKEQDDTLAYPLVDMVGSRVGGPWVASMLMPAYQTSRTFCLDPDSGEVVYGPMTENFRNYLRKVNEWYETGLIDPEFMSYDSSTMNGDLATGKYVASSSLQLSYNILGATSMARAANPDFEFVGAPWPVMESGDPVCYFLPDTYWSGNQTAVTSSCENPELAVKVLDYFYSDEGEELLGWGIEGESFERDADGTRHFTELITNNPDGKTMAEAIAPYAIPTYNFTNLMLRDSYVQMVTSMPEQEAARELWLDAEGGVNLPRLSVATDVQSDYSRIMNEVETFVQEQYVLFVSGQLDLDADWDSYIATMEGMNIELARSAKADAYERFQNR